MAILQVKLRETVQPLINKARGTHCEQCLSKKQLQAKLVFELEDLAAQFAAEYPADEFDKVRGEKGTCNVGSIPQTIIHKCITVADLQRLPFMGIYSSRRVMNLLPIRNDPFDRMVTNMLLVKVKVSCRSKFVTGVSFRTGRVCCEGFFI